MELKTQRWANIYQQPHQLNSLLLGCEEAYIGRYIGVVTAWTYLTPMLYVPTDSLSEGRPGLSSFNSSHIGGVESGPSLLRGRWDDGLSTAAVISASLLGACWGKTMTRGARVWWGARGRSSGESHLFVLEPYLRFTPQDSTEAQPQSIENESEPFPARDRFWFCAWRRLLVICFRKLLLQFNNFALTAADDART